MTPHPPWQLRQTVLILLIAPIKYLPNSSLTPVGSALPEIARVALRKPVAAQDQVGRQYRRPHPGRVNGWACDPGGDGQSQEGMINPIAVG
jgi:hypothetical protein